MKKLSLLCLIGIAGFGVAGCEYHTYQTLEPGRILEGSEKPAETSGKTSPKTSEDIQAPSASANESAGKDTQTDAQIEGLDEFISSPTEAPAETTPPEVTGIYGGDNPMTVLIHFSEPVDLASISMNDSIQFRVDGVGVSPIEGEFMNDPADPNVIKFMAQSPFVTSLKDRYWVKILGANSADPSKAVVDVSKNMLEAEYEMKLSCGGPSYGRVICN